MDREERLIRILQILRDSEKPVTGTALAREMKVSRQVIVQDIVLLRANGENILSTRNGYLIKTDIKECSRVYKVIHTDAEAEEELQLFVDCGGTVKDVFVYHKAYGVIRADLNIKSRLDASRFMEQVHTGQSGLLSKVTSGYHYHTITADNTEILDLIYDRLAERGFLASLKDYEPINFYDIGDQ